jgi:hypothetical protein
MQILTSAKAAGTLREVYMGSLQSVYLSCAASRSGRKTFRKQVQTSIMPIETRKSLVGGLDH